MLINGFCSFLNHHFSFLCFSFLKIKKPVSQKTYGILTGVKINYILLQNLQCRTQKNAFPVEECILVKSSVNALLSVKSPSRNRDDFFKKFLLRKNSPKQGFIRSTIFCRGAGNSGKNSILHIAACFLQSVSLFEELRA